jgi:hypothetical protein
MTTISTNIERRLRSSSLIKRRGVEKILDSEPKQAEWAIQMLGARANEREAIDTFFSMPLGKKRIFMQLLQMANEHPEMAASLQVLTEVYKSAKMPNTSQLYERLAQSFQRVGDKHEEVQQADPLRVARDRGALMRKQMLHEHGGVISAEQVGKLLGLTRQAVEARRQTGKLLAYAIEGPRYRYPRWQFDAQEDHVLPGLDRVLAALADLSPWSKGRFMTTGDIRLNGETPLDCLKAGEVEAVVRAAQAYGEQYAT